jgi:hypothetical protein
MARSHPTSSSQSSAQDLSPLERVIDAAAVGNKGDAAWLARLKNAARLARIKEAEVGEEAPRQAQEAIAALKLSEAATRILVDDLLTARRFLRTHRYEVDQVQRLLTNAPKARAAFRKALRYISASGFVISKDDPLLEAQRIIANEIASLESFGELRSRRLSRRGDAAAARARAIAWIGRSVRRLSGKSHVSEVIALCDFALGGSTSLDAVKRAGKE